VGVLAEIGDLSRFQNPRELMGYLGLVPSESSTGDKVKRGGITKAGNGRARRIFVEAAWSYRYPPRVSREKQPKVEAAPRAVRGGKRKPDCAGAFGRLGLAGGLHDLGSAATVGRQKDDHRRDAERAALERAYTISRTRSKGRNDRDALLEGGTISPAQAFIRLHSRT
jgi:hypothetical protein